MAQPADARAHNQQDGARSRGDGLGRKLNSAPGSPPTPQNSALSHRRFVAHVCASVSTDPVVVLGPQGNTIHPPDKPAKPLRSVFQQRFRRFSGTHCGATCLGSRG